MLKRTTKKLVDVMYESGLITQDDIEIYRFGIETALFKLIHYITLLLVGLFFGMVLQAIIFTLSFSIIREYAGGYHAKSRFRCYSISVFMITSVLLISKLCPTQIMFWISISTCIPSFMTIFFLAPVENINKPLDNLEIEHYKKLTRIILLVEEMIALAFLFVNIQIFTIVNISLIYVSILLLFGKIQNNKKLVAR
jgi:Membrane protein putatively involved in post-translational modification of the autoinducing quorum-sensing peptide